MAAAGPGASVVNLIQESLQGPRMLKPSIIVLLLALNCTRARPPEIEEGSGRKLPAEGDDDSSQQPGGAGPPAGTAQEPRGGSGGSGVSTQSAETSGTGSGTQQGGAASASVEAGTGTAGTTDDQTGGGSTESSQGTGREQKTNNERPGEGTGKKPPAAVITCSDRFGRTHADGKSWRETVHWQPTAADRAAGFQDCLNREIECSCEAGLLLCDGDISSRFVLERPSGCEEP